jgi:hypothetical protein
MSRYSNDSDGIFVIGVFLFILFAFAISALVFFNTQDTVHNALVQEKERVVTKDSSKYLIYTDGEVFKNTDNIFALKFNSSDIYGHVKKDCSYTFDVYGFRVPFLSMYRNITNVYDEQCNEPH